jgi:hypothetical protein
LAIHFCPNCGRESKGEKFCPECGTSTFPDDPNVNDISSSNKRQIAKRFVISLVLILAIFAGAAIYFLTKDSASDYISRACISMSDFDPYTKSPDERLLKARSLQRAVQDDVQAAERIDPALASSTSRAFVTLNDYVESLERWDTYFNLYDQSEDVSYLLLAISVESSYKTLALSFKSQTDSACKS